MLNTMAGSRSSLTRHTGRPGEALRDGMGSKTETNIDRRQGRAMFSWPQQERMGVETGEARACQQEAGEPTSGGSASTRWQGRRQGPSRQPLASTAWARWYDTALLLVPGSRHRAPKLLAISRLEGRLLFTVSPFPSPLGLC